MAPVCANVLLAARRHVLFLPLFPFEDQIATSVTKRVSGHNSRCDVAQHAIEVLKPLTERTSVKGPISYASGMKRRSGGKVEVPTVVTSGHEVRKFAVKKLSFDSDRNVVVGISAYLSSKGRSLLEATM